MGAPQFPRTPVVAGIALVVDGELVVDELVVDELVVDEVVGASWVVAELALVEGF